jgi:hypothetical protein
MIKPVSLAVLLAVVPAAAAAQDTRSYAGGSLVWWWQDTRSIATSDPHISRPGVGGFAVAGGGEYGWLLTARSRVSVEATVPARFESIQETPDVLGRRVRVENRHRELVFSGVYRIDAVQTGRIRFGLLAGPSVVLEDTLQRRAERDFLTFPGSQPDFGPYGPQTRVTRWAFGLTFGADLAVDIARHVSVVPDIRIHWINRAAGNGSASGHLALEPLVIRPGVGIRLAF